MLMVIEWCRSRSRIAPAITESPKTSTQAPRLWSLVMMIEASLVAARDQLEEQIGQPHARTARGGAAADDHADRTIDRARVQMLWAEPRRHAPAFILRPSSDDADRNRGWQRHSEL